MPDSLTDYSQVVASELLSPEYDQDQQIEDSYIELQSYCKAVEETEVV